jgi:hypothetical protein
MLTYDIKVRLGSNFRETLINESFVQGTWALSTGVAPVVYDISGADRHGTITGTPTRYVSATTLPEGALGMTFTNTQEITVLDAPGLSLENGSMDVVIMLKTTTNDANHRAIVVKYDGTNGWFVNLISGGIRFGLVVSGVSIFDFTRGSIADGNEHIIHCCYEPEVNRCRIFIDGVQSGAEATGTTEPADISANLKIAGWNHIALTANRFIGTIWYVSVGREGNPDLAASLELARVWATLDCAKYLRRGSLVFNHGTSSGEPIGATVEPSTAEFTLNNFNPNGYFSPSHMNVWPGFRTGIPIKITATFDTPFASGHTTASKQMFTGIIKSLTPTTGEHSEKAMHVKCVDWMEVPAHSPIGPTEVLLNVASNRVILRLLDQAIRSPHAVLSETGDETFPYALDNVDSVNGKIIQEIAEVNFNEGGTVFMKKDGTFTVHARSHRQLPAATGITLLGEFQELDPTEDLDNIVNIALATVYPREPGTSATDTVVAMTKRQQILAGGTLVLDLRYTDPNQLAVEVGATDLPTALVPTTDYTMTQNEDGTGTDLTSSVVFHTQQIGSSSTHLEVVNTHATLTGWFTTIVRARLLKRYNPQTTTVENRTSIRRYDPRDNGGAINFKYLNTVAQGATRAQYLVDLRGTPRMLPRVLTYQPDIYAPTNALEQLMNLEVNDKVLIGEPMSAITTDSEWWINALNYSHDDSNSPIVQITLVPAQPSGNSAVLDDTETALIDSALVGY